MLLAVGMIETPAQVFLMDAYQVSAKIAGVVILLFGLVFLSGGRKTVPLGLPGAFVLGGLLGAVWPHCIGPILAEILNLSTLPWTAVRGSLLLICYSLGLTTSFALVGLGLGRAFKLLVAHTSFEQRQTLATATGVVLVGLGILLMLTIPWLSISRVFIGFAHDSPVSSLERLLMQAWR